MLRTAGTALLTIALSLLRGCEIENTDFHESGLSPNKYYIGVQDVNVIDSNVFVDGPQCKWYNWSWGWTGTIEQKFWD